MWDYTDKVKDHFFNPRNVGKIEDYDGIGTVGSIACGDALTLTFKLDESKKKIIDAKFQTFGCASAIASSSALTEMLKGMDVEAAAKISNQDIADYLGGLPDQKMHCSVMGREALEAAMEYLNKGGKAVEKAESSPVTCVCFGVSQDEIIRVIEENNLTTIEEVTNYTKAGGGCGGCHPDIQMILNHKIAERKGAKSPDGGRQKMTNLKRIQLVEEIIERDIKPMLRNDGGDIDLIDVDGTKVTVALRGNCSGCNIAHVTLRDVVEARLKEFVDEEITVEEEK